MSQLEEIGPLLLLMPSHPNLASGLASKDVSGEAVTVASGRAFASRSSGIRWTMWEAVHGAAQGGERRAGLAHPMRSTSRCGPPRSGGPTFLNMPVTMP